MSNQPSGGSVDPTTTEERSAAGAQPNSESDELIALMGRYAQGDVRAFDRLFALLSPRIYGFHLRSLGNTAMAEDLTQTTFFKLHVARRRYRPGAPVEPWIFAIAKNAQRDRLRRYRRMKEQLTEQGELPQSLETAVPPRTEDVFERERLARAVRELPEGQRDVVVMHKFEGLSMKEVADALGIGLSAAKVRAFRAYGALRELLEDDAKR